MNRRPRLSLRARLLAALLTVAFGFLAVLGLVTSVVIGKRLGNDFDSQLRTDASRRVPLMVGTSDSYDVFYVGKSHETGLISAASPVGSQLESYLSQLIASHVIGPRPRVAQFTPFTIDLPNGPKLRAVWRVVRRNSESGQSVVPVGPAVIVVARPLSQREAPLRQVILAEIITGGALIVLLTVTGPWLIWRGLAPLDRMATTADDITARGDLTARMPDPGDRAEAGRLSAAINTMLDRIQQAFSARLASEQKVRQFAADASHELRTPLTTIRGYAELYRQGALGPDRLPDAMRRIEQESDRMSKLVA